MTNPLETLAEHLDDDMRAVNACIMENMQSPVDTIPKLARYLIAAGGKRIRPLLILAATALYEGEMRRAHALATAVEFIHSATLLHDDVVDESTTRRGQEVANLVFGNQVSVLVGDFLFARAFQLMVSDGSLDVLKILSDTAAIITQGEVLQLSVAGNPETSLETYIDIIKAKTAVLFAAACEVGPVIGGADKAAAAAMAEYGLNLGIAFQIVDDALDYAADQAALGKTIGDDFREGKITAPVLIVMARATDEEQDFLRQTLAQDTRSGEDLSQMQGLIEKYDAITQSLVMARDYGDKARLALAEAPDHRLRAVLDDLVEYILRRDR
jgi:octaprenyl-diphosphate synthase